METENNRVLKIFCMLFLFLGISNTVVGPMIPVIAREINIGYDKIGLVLLVGSIFSIVFTILLGWLSDKYDIKKIIIMALIMIFLGFLIFGVYLNFILFFLVIILIRSGIAIMDSTSRTLIAKLFYQKHTKIYMKLAIYWSMGAVLGPLLVSIFLFFNSHYRLLNILVSLLFFCGFIFFYKEIFNKNNNRADDREVDSLIVKPEAPVFKKAFNSIVITCGFLVLFNGAIFFGLSDWLTTYFTAFNMEVSTSSLFLSLFWVFAIPGLFIINKLLKIINETAILLMSYAIGSISLVLLILFDEIYLKIIFLLLFALCFQGTYPLISSISAYENPGHTGTIMGFNISFYFIGGIIAQPVIGYVSEYSGEEFSVYIILAASIASLLLNCILFKLQNKKYKIKFKSKFKSN
jgi:MFS transporter, FHS family, glucose/mannose:H+ symporter